MPQFRINLLLTFSLLAFGPLARAADAPTVRTLRILEGGVQPQAAVDEKGVVHLIYLKGDPGQADIFYIRSADSGKTFSAPIRVNSQAGSAMAIGTVRGAHIAVGKAGRVHVSWSGSSSAQPRSINKTPPMLYARLSDDGASFEPQRNIVQAYPAPDMIGSVAADTRGNVYVGWHAPSAKGEGEQSQKVWLARSNDDGKTFAVERAISGDAGVCGCCGMRMFATDDSLYVLYRTADHKTERDMALIRMDAGSEHPKADIVGQQQSPICLMSTAAFAPAAHGVVAAWEANGQIYWSSIAGKAAINATPVPGRPGGRKHPAAATNAAGNILVVWTEGTGWQRGGTIGWQVYDASGNAITTTPGRADRLPAWGAGRVLMPGWIVCDCLLNFADVGYLRRVLADRSRDRQSPPFFVRPHHDVCD